MGMTAQERVEAAQAAAAAGRLDASSMEAMGRIGLLQDASEMDVDD